MTPTADPLVEQMKQELSQQGYQPPAPSGTTDWHSQIKSRFDTSSAPAADTSSDNFSLSAPQPNPVDTASDIGNDFNKRADNVGRILNSGDAPSSKVLQIGGEGAAVVNDTIGSVIKQVVNPDVLKVVTSTLSPAVQAAAAEPHVKSIIDWFGTLDPETQRNLSAGGQIGLLLSNAVGVGAAKKVGEVAMDEGVQNTVKDAVAPVFDKASELASRASDSAAALRARVATNFAAKTPEEVLATPESDVYKLAPDERKYWFDNQKATIASNHDAAQSAIDQKAAETEAKIKADLQVKSDALQKMTEDLNRQVQTSSRDEVLDLRPKIQKALGAQSQQYRSLVDAELAPYKATPVSQDELGQFIETKFSADPEKIQAIKNKLGIEDGGKGTTIGALYSKSLDLGQDISSSVKKGTRVYNPDEVMTDNAISTLTDFMKSKGIDLSAARTFWAKYAPIRNQLVSEAKPFLQSPTQTKTFANTIIRVAKGSDVNNENFIAATEDLLGQKVGVKTSAALAKLSTVEKEQLAAEIDAQTKIADARLEKAAASNVADDSTATVSQALKDKQFMIEKMAARRAVVKKVLHKALTIGIGSMIGNQFGGLQGEAAGGLLGLAL